ncbi:MAG: hypothetical protein JST01_22045 [Cyanobacteria bacterium SZAS TMP-1]|nr:hypothetical protein [Cyanobacteria bacterium SZAS TMP-1]
MTEPQKRNLPARLSTYKLAVRPIARFVTWGSSLVALGFFATSLMHMNIVMAPYGTTVLAAIFCTVAISLILAWTVRTNSVKWSMEKRAHLERVLMILLAIVIFLIVSGLPWKYSLWSLEAGTLTLLFCTSMIIAVSIGLATTPKHTVDYPKLSKK